jgi:succinate dehydrogenase/fumarate reductase flavoprotein subunit
VDVRDLEFKVRRLINDYVISPKNAYKLGRWMEWAERFEREIEEEVSVANGHELSKVFEVEHIIQCATFSARAALERKESRWGNAHQRTDFPQRDDPNWLCHVDMRRGKDGEILVSRRPLVRDLPSGGAR